jgi:hypothetical protein
MKHNGPSTNYNISGKTVKFFHSDCQDFAPVYQPYSGFHVTNLSLLNGNGKQSSLTKINMGDLYMGL